MELKGHIVNPGLVEGEALVTSAVFLFEHDIDSNGAYVGADNEIKGTKLNDKIFVFHSGRGTSLGSAKGFTLKKQGMAPRGMICPDADTLTGLFAITADIPLMDKLDKNPLESIRTGDHVKLDANRGLIEVNRKEKHGVTKR